MFITYTKLNYFIRFSDAIVWGNSKAAYDAIPPAVATGYETGGIMAAKRLKRGLGF